MNNNILKLIIIVIFIMIIIILILLKILGTVKEEDNINTADNNIEENTTIDLQTDLIKISEIGQYYNGLHYIKQYNNQRDNIFFPNKAYYKEFGVEQSIFIYDGNVYNDGDVKKCCYGIIIDYDKMLYKIIEGSSVEEINSMDLNYNIERNDDNAYEYYYVKDEEIVRDVYNNFKFNFQYNSSSIYENLVEEYKQKRFDNDIANFNEYVINMQENIENSVITGYKIDNISENETKYVIENSNKNQFIFIQDENLDYTIMLDTYTILDNDYRSNYTVLNNESKVHTDIDMFIKMINTKDYTHAYGKLDETFRINNFGSVENFIEYMNRNFYKTNFLNIDTIEERDGIYIVKTTITDSISSAAETMEKQFIVKLGEGTDFIMSFNIN